LNREDILLTYSSEPEKIISLLGGKDFVMSMGENTIIFIINNIINFLYYQNENNIYTQDDKNEDERRNNFIRALLTTGGKEFIMKFKPKFVLGYFTSYYSS
jgi:hypothetical protein